MSQIKEQNKTLENEQNKMETSNLLDAEFKTLVKRMLKELKGRVEELKQNFNSLKKDMETIKKDQSEMKDNLQGINGKVDKAKNQISDLEYKKAKNTQVGQQKEKRIPSPHQYSVRSLWDNQKHTHISIMGVPEEEEREQENEKLFGKNNDRITGIRIGLQVNGTERRGQK